MRVPDNSVSLTVCNVGIVCEEDGVVGHHWITGRQNASCRVAHTVQDAVVHQEVVHKQLYTQRHIQILLPGVRVKKKKLNAQVTADREAYPKLLHSSLWCLRVIPQLDHGHRHWLIKDDVHTVHLHGNTQYTQLPTLI